MENQVDDSATENRLRDGLGPRLYSASADAEWLALPLSLTGARTRQVPVERAIDHLRATYTSLPPPPPPRLCAI